MGVCSSSASADESEVSPYQQTEQASEEYSHIEISYTSSIAGRTGTSTSAVTTFRPEKRSVALQQFKASNSKEVAGSDYVSGQAMSLTAPQSLLLATQQQSLEGVIDRLSKHSLWKSGRFSFSDRLLLAQQLVDATLSGDSDRADKETRQLGSRDLASAIAKNPMIEEIDACNSFLDDDFVLELADCLGQGHLRQLRILHLDSNCFGSLSLLHFIETVIEVGESIALCEITVRDQSCGCFGDKIGWAFVDAIQACPSLLHISLDLKSPDLAQALEKLTSARFRAEQASQPGVNVAGTRRTS